MVDEAEIFDVALSDGVESCARRLVDLANRYGGQDNITVIVIEVVG